jgi:hypothetical protein
MALSLSLSSELKSSIDFSSEVTLSSSSSLTSCLHLRRLRNLCDLVENDWFISAGARMRNNIVHTGLLGLLINNVQIWASTGYTLSYWLASKGSFWTAYSYISIIESNKLEIPKPDWIGQHWEIAQKLFEISKPLFKKNKNIKFLLVQLLIIWWFQNFF